MEVAEVIETTHNIHAHHQGLKSANECAGTAYQMIQSLTEGSVESFDVSSIYRASSFLRNLDQALYQFFAALHNTTVNAQHTVHPLLDDLHKGDIRPSNQLATPPFTAPTWQLAAKSQPESGDVTGQTATKDDKAQSPLLCLPVPGSKPNLVCG